MIERIPAGDDKRSTWPRRRPAALIAVVLAISLIGGVAWQLGRAADGGQAAASPRPPSTPSATPTVTTPPPYDRQAIAKLEATDESGGVIPVDASFRLTSLDGSPAADLAARVVVEPAVHLDIAPDGDTGSVRLTPTEPLVAGAVYRFALEADDGRLLDTWAFQAHQGVRVVSTVPGHEQTDVPIDTGIEITFDQDGVTGAEDHVTIDPALEGRFEQHGRTLVFVPKALAPATAYTVTVSSGITVAATGEASTETATFRFETAGEQPALGGWLEPQDDLIESATAARPTIGFWVIRDSETFEPPASIGVEVYRLPSIEAAADAFQTGRSWRWLRLSGTGLTDTAGLTRVLSADLPLEEFHEAVWAALPEPLPAGWYLVRTTDRSRPTQAILQVTDLSAYLAISDTKTVVWANDMSSGGPVSGATVSGDGRELGRTGADGLLLTDTPATLLPAGRGECRVDCDPVLSVTTSDGREAILPATGQLGRGGYFDPYGWYSDASPRYWTLFNTDRTLFRPTDQIDAWGMLRDRDTGEVPESLVIRLVPRPEARSGEVPSVAAIEVRPRASGVFAGSIALVGMPIGAYSLELVVGDDVVTSTWVQVGQILKPAYRLGVETGHRVYIAGDRVRVDVQASFYDGSPAPGVPVQVVTDFLESEVTTDATGAGVIRTTASVGEYNEGQPDYKQLYVHPARPEEGEIDGASEDFIVFPSSRTIDATSEISSGRVRVAGGVHVVDQERLEREVRAGASIYEVDPRGDAVSGARVTVRFVELVPVRRDPRQEYDFLQKKVVTVYEYDIEEREAGTKTVRADASGRFSASVDAGRGDHDYDVYLSVGDPDGRAARQRIYTSRVVWDRDDHRFATLSPTDQAEDYDRDYSIGESLDLTFRATTAGGQDPAFLFVEAQRGVRSAVVQSSARYATPFEAADAPGVNVYGIRFNGSGYESSWFYAPFRMSDHSLDVQLSTASRGLKPGDDVTVDLVVRDASGKPAAGTVIVRAVDEKLYTIGAAEDVNVLWSLYQSVTSGIRTTYQTHRPPQGETSGGDTGGGDGDRFDFQDSLVFKVIETDATGRGSISFKLSDDLTSWRVSAAALTSDLRAGNGTLQLPVGLPFFVDATIAPEYLASDRPTVLVRAFGSALEAGDAVSITADSPSLGFKTGPLSGKAFESIAIPLPELRPGRHEITIRATTGRGSSALSDGVKRTFVVVDSRLTRSDSAHVDVTTSTHLEGGDGLTTVVVSDAGASRHLQLLLDLAGKGGSRLDSSLAAAVARSPLIDRFGIAPGSLPPTDFSAAHYQTPDGGLALLPYSSSDLELSAMAAIAGRDQIDGSRLESYLRSVHENDKETRERRIIALAGLAGLGAPVLPELRAAAADSQLTTRERLFVGIGAARVGDAVTARAVIADLVDAYGEQVDGRIRLRVGASAEDSASATALMAVLTASAGDERAPAFWAYVDANPPRESVLDLHAVAYATAAFDWLKIEPARFAWTLDGARTVVELAPGTASAFSLTAGQLAGFTIERLDGAIGVSTSWREPAQPADFTPDPDVSITRHVTPEGGVLSSDELVVVDLVVTFSPNAASGCHEVTDHVPSGLVPVGNSAAWVEPGSEDPMPQAVLPYFQGNQVVRWCAEPRELSRTAELRYYARVITPGRYTWEPSMVDSKTIHGAASLTKAATVEIR